MKVSFCTLGCKVNQYESEAMAEALTEAGWEVVPFGTRADATILNTCAVTTEAERKVRQMIRRAAAFSPEGFLVVTGCAAQLHPAALTPLKGVCFICGNGRKMQAVEAILSHFSELPQREDPSADSFSLTCFEDMTINKSERTRAYIKIEDGCDSHCAYCIIRKARGAVRSKPKDAVLAEARGLAAAGYREIVLTGIEISAYGKDLDCDLADLLAALDGIPGLARIRLGSLDPALLRPAFIEKLVKIEHLCPHFHLSLQSGCDKTLRAMRRKSNTAQIKEAVDALRASLPEATFTADLIAGFPGESDEDFAETLAFVESLTLLDFHIFAFSPRPGTEAADLPDQIPGKVKAAREKALASLREKMRHKLLASYVGKEVEVLFEENEEGFSVGHTAGFLEVAVETEEALHNRLLPVRLIKADRARLIGSLLTKTSQPQKI